MIHQEDYLQRAIFKDPAREAEFRKNGYVKIPFFNADELQQAIELCNKLDGGFNTSFTTTIWSENATYRKTVYNELKKIYTKPVSQVLKDCKLVMATILHKHPAEDSAIDIHQDWAFTNEQKYTAVNIWVPLIDTNLQNGALHFLPYSHLFKVPYRGRHINPQFILVKNKIWELGKFCMARAGEAIIFNVQMIHYSLPNTTAITRTATAMVAIPTEAPILHYINYEPEKNQLVEMEVDEIFYNSFAHNDHIPISAQSKKIEFIRQQLDMESFLKEYLDLCNNATQL
ncbi:MAG: phytanoyl-CoA dioxygenase family protein [Chitinophagales bacterium]